MEKNEEDLAKVLQERTTERKRKMAILERKFAASDEEKELVDYKYGMSFITEKLSDSNFLTEMLKSNMSFSEMLEKDKSYMGAIENTPELKDLVDEFSKALDFTITSVKPKNPIIGQQSKSRADDFAKAMGVHLGKVRNEGFTSTRAIAKRLNELNIKSALGHDWSHSTVYQLINRRKKMGLEGEQNDSPELG